MAKKTETDELKDVVKQPTFKVGDVIIVTDNGLGKEYDKDIGHVAKIIEPYDRRDRTRAWIVDPKPPTGTQLFSEDIRLATDVEMAQFNRNTEKDKKIAELQAEIQKITNGADELDNKNRLRILDLERDFEASNTALRVEREGRIKDKAKIEVYESIIPLHGKVTLER